MTYPAEPTLGPFGERLRERTAPLAPHDDEYGFAHAYLCGAWGAIFREVAQVFDPEDPLPPFAPLLDPNLCPAWALPWLAQWVGVRIPAGTSEADARKLIAELRGFRRGTTRAMRSVLAAYGLQTVFFRERDGGDAYRLEIVAQNSELPDDVQPVIDALMAQKPGGIILAFRGIDGWDYQRMTGEGGTYADVAGRFANYRALSENDRS